MREPFEEFVREKLGSDFLLIACGLPGTWKTETTAEVSKIKGYPILRTDLIRLEVLKGEDVFDPKVAANMDKRNLVYDETFRRADEALAKGSGVILDATFITQSLRRRAAAIAAKHHRTFIILQTDCSEEVSLRRIQARTKDEYESNALTPEAYFSNKKRFEPVALDDLKKLHPNLNIVHLTVDTTHDEPQGWYITNTVKR